MPVKPAHYPVERLPTFAWNGCPRSRGIDARHRVEHAETMIISPDDPGSAAYHSENNTRFRRDDWHASLQTKIRVACTQTTFRVTGSMIAHDGEAVFAERLFDETIPRDHL